MSTRMDNTYLFYCNQYLHTITGADRSALLRGGDRLLAERPIAGPARPLATDQNDSVIHVGSSHALSYAPYGFNSAILSKPQLAAFNGERLEPVSAGYALGNGNRLFSPRLMRFLGADTFSPFEQGGLNCYCYCLGDPINRTDPNGHWSIVKPRTWFRSPNTKLRQRLSAMAKIRPKLNEATAELQPYIQEKVLRRPFDLIEQASLDAARSKVLRLLPKAERKARGIAKYAPSGESYQFPDIDKAKNALMQTQRQPATLPEKSKRTFFDRSVPRDDPYDDVNYWNNAIRQQ